MGNKSSRQNAPANIDDIFNYDSAYRLIQSVNDNNPTDYNLDLSQNRTQVAGLQNPGNYTLDNSAPDPADAQLNQYTTSPQGNRLYDDNGNLLTDAPNRVFTYDYTNRMVAFNDESTNASYQYDAFGRRIAKVVDGQTTRFFYSSGNQVCEEQDVTNNTLATYVYGLYIDDVVQMQRGNEDYFYHTDDLYSTMAVTNSTGNTVESFSYSDFGQPSAPSAIGNPYLFTGRRFDPETGFYYNRTRYLDPQVGRFSTRDNMGIWGDTENSGNGYTYVANNPLNKVDPFGLWTISFGVTLEAGIGAMHEDTNLGFISNLSIVADDDFFNYYPYDYRFWDSFGVAYTGKINPRIAGAHAGISVGPQITTARRIRDFEGDSETVEADVLIGSGFGFGRVTGKNKSGTRCYQGFGGSYGWGGGAKMQIIENPYTKVITVRDVGRNVLYRPIMWGLNQFEDISNRNPTVRSVDLWLGRMADEYFPRSGK